MTNIYLLEGVVRDLIKPRWFRGQVFSESPLTRPGDILLVRLSLLPEEDLEYVRVGALFDWCIQLDGGQKRYSTFVWKDLTKPRN